jgi:hypothetical protein
VPECNSNCKDTENLVIAAMALYAPIPRRIWEPSEVFALTLRNVEAKDTSRHPDEDETPSH